jgi:hypothetical protein
MWKIQIKEQKMDGYLQDNDYIYFMSSLKNKGIMNVECDQDGSNYSI